MLTRWLSWLPMLPGYLVFAPGRRAFADPNSPSPDWKRTGRSMSGRSSSGSIRGPRDCHPPRRPSGCGEYGPNELREHQTTDEDGRPAPAASQSAAAAPGLCRGGVRAVRRVARFGHRPRPSSWRRSASDTPGSTARRRLRRRCARACACGPTCFATAVRRSCRSKLVVPGDVVLLSAGSLVPADGVILDATDCFVSEAVLTGESFPVEKRAGVAAGVRRSGRAHQLRLPWARTCAAARRAASSSRRAHRPSSAPSRIA